jgi:hypothetical protein
MRTMSRSQIVAQQNEQLAAWDVLTKTAVWAPRLNALRIEGGELTTHQLASLLGANQWCHELWLYKCAQMGSELWAWLGLEWEAGSKLRVLGVGSCGGEIEDEALDGIDGLKGLQVSGKICFECLFFSFLKSCVCVCCADVCIVFESAGMSWCGC